MPRSSKKVRGMREKLKDLRASGKLKKAAGGSEEVQPGPSVETPTSPQPGPSEETQTPLHRPSLAKDSSASKRKALFDFENGEDIVDSKMCITAQEEIRNMLNCVVCKICHGKVKCKVSKFGLDSTLQLTCEQCRKNIYDTKTKKTCIRNNTERFVPTYLQLVYSCMSGGVGYRSMQGIIASQGLPVMSSSVFERYKHYVTSVMKTVWKKHVNESVPVIFKYYEEELGRLPDHDGILDIDITYDGEYLQIIY